jgi:site-specific recombinase XerD
MPPNLEQTIECYLQRWAPTLRPNTLLSKRTALRSLTRYLHAEHPELQHWSQLQRVPHIEGWLQHILYLKASSRIVQIRNLRLFFDDLIGWDWPEAPAPGLISDEDMPPEPLQLPKPLPPEVDQAVQRALAEAPGLAARGLLLLRLTGMRLGEMRALPLNTLERVHAQRCSLRVPLGKTGAERLIPLNPRAIALIEDILAERGRRRPVPAHLAHYLMVDAFGRHLTRQSYGRTLKDLSAHIHTTERIYPHRLRHTFATEMSRAGMPLPALMKLLGHQTPKMTMRYVEVAHTDLRLAYDQALVQLRVMNMVDSAPVPTTQTTAIQPAPDELPKLMEAVVSRLENLRRDASDPARVRDLHRFVKRIRKAQHDLEKLL